MQKLNFSKLRLLHEVACKRGDGHMAVFIGEPPCPMPHQNFSLALSPRLRFKIFAIASICAAEGELSLRLSARQKTP